MAGFDAVVQQRILIVGDSKSISSNSWPGTLVTSLNTAASPSPQFAQDNVAAAGQGAGYFAPNISTILAGQPDNHTIVLYSVGVNDFGTATMSAWIADMQTTLDAIHTKWPTALVYVSKPWKQGFDATADTFAGWVDTVVASRSFARAADDERSWLKPNVATYTIDGVHYSAAGETAKAHQMKTVLGY